MTIIIKKILILISIFLLIYWLQSYDDKKYNIKRKSFYDKYKIPIFYCAIIGIILNYINIFSFSNEKINNLINCDQEIYIEPLYKYV